MKAGWRVVPLGEVCTLQRGFDLPTSQRVPGRFPLVTSSGPTDTHDEAKVKGPGVVTGRSGSIGNVFFVQKDFWPLNTALYVKDFHGNDPKFVWYLLQFFDLSRFSSGTGVPTLNRNDVHGEAVSIPVSTAEQKRIVAVLDEAFEGLSRARANAEANLADARELFAEALKAEFARSPDDWREVALSEIGATVTGSTPRTSDSGNLGGYLPFIKPGDFLPDGRLDYGNEGLSEKGAAVSRILSPGCALMVCIGATIGKAAYSEQKIATNQQINALVPSSGISGEFVYLQMISPDFQRDVLRNAGQATLPIINKSKWSALKVRVPKNLAWQHEITERMRSLRDVISDLEARYSSGQMELDTLRQSLLQKAFSGELT